MLIYRRTSIFESPAQTLVNTVNCVGVMGKGLAHAFREREPEMFKAYKQICKQKALMPGKLWLWRGRRSWVLNFPTKMHWRNPSNLAWIEEGLEKFISSYAEQGINEISFPRLGCGNGNLEWEEVRPVMEFYLSKVDIPVYIHDFEVNVGLPEHLAPIAAALKAAGDDCNSFDGFIEMIANALELSQLSTLGTQKFFAARMREDRGLAIETSTQTCLFEEEDLRSVWLDLQNGLVTKRKAEWAISNGGESLLSLLSILPNVRPVQIQRMGNNEPEYAIEPRPDVRGFAVTEQSNQLPEILWH
jgi:O-acetyl-ADP-ribose deacetylase (regulator of RNase III)